MKFVLCFLLNVSIFLGILITTSANADSIFGEPELRELRAEFENPWCLRSCETDDWVIQAVDFPPNSQHLIDPDDVLFLVTSQESLCGSRGCVQAYVLRDNAYLTVLAAEYNIGIKGITAAYIPARNIRNQAWYRIERIHSNESHLTQTADTKANKNNSNISQQCKARTLIVPKSKEVCQFSLDNKSVIHYLGRRISNPIAVNHGSDGSKLLAESLIIYPPSPTSRYFYIKACEEIFPKDGLCWSQWLFDSERNKLESISIGKYGAHPEIYWSRNSNYAVLFFSSGGLDVVNVLDATSGTVFQFPDWERGDIDMLNIDRNSLFWINQNTFSVKAARCTEDSEELCDSPKKDTLFKFSNGNLSISSNR